MSLLCVCLMRALSVILALFSCFAIPWFGALMVFKYHTTSEQPHSPNIPIGSLLAPGTQVLLSEQSNDWTLLCLKPIKANQRWELWQQQVALFPRFLKNDNLRVLTQDFDDLSPQEQEQLASQVSWSLDHEGGAILLDSRGFASLAFPFDASPKSSFFVMRKLLSS